MAAPTATRALAALGRAAAGCTECPLYERATQTVFGEGPVDARIVMLGEQPGDHEDREGHVFIGPAGHLLDQALGDAGLDRSAIYLSNVVKHFKWTPSPRSDKVRIHAKPNRREAAACEHWWRSELDVVRPSVVGALGAVAAQAVHGSAFKLTQHRGEPILVGDATVVATFHPSAVLRARERRREMYTELVDDLARIAELAG
ncbi:MAG TPA: UdgX family uracil-DNA binding protein [Acidimicrobiia bacterium]|jgi:DNA polymerase